MIAGAHHRGDGCSGGSAAGMTQRTAAQRHGDAAEQLVADRLALAGWTVLARQVRIGRDELDLMAIDPGPPRELVVIEVRWRARRDFGVGEETFDWRKQLRLRRAMARLVGDGRLPDGRPLPALAARVDLVVVEPGPTGGAKVVRHHRAVLAG